MPSATVKDDLLPSEKNRSYYDVIAPRYDAILDEDAANQIIRKKVEEKFISLVKPGWVLDFGGGSGRDLEWLKNKYHIFFCEPSEGMRQKAIDLYKDPASTEKIVFLDNDKTDFTNWHLVTPFDINVEGVLADFAVLNCIADIELLFKNLAALVKPGGHFVALMLQKNYKRPLLWKIREAVRSTFSKEPLMYNTQYGVHKQMVYVYTKAELINAAETYFEFNSKEPLYEFNLFHFVRK